MSDVTKLLDAIRSGDPNAQEELWTVVYEEFRRIAEGRMAQERPGHTLQATALVHEVWLRLGGTEHLLKNRGHFFGVAATAMRRILVDHARKRIRDRRGGGKVPISLDDIDVASLDTPSEVILAVDEALQELEKEDSELARIVELRFFTGLSIPEVARELGISERTVKRRWEYARAFLYEELRGG